jgi:uncharacterized RDD family membrane protein YckC
MRTDLEDGSPAPRLRRALARAADAVTVFAVLWVLVVLQILWFMDDLSDRVTPEPWGRAFTATATYVVLAVTYEVVFLRWNGGVTPGKDLVKLRVVVRPVEGRGDGGPGAPAGLGVGRAVVRALVSDLVWLVPPVGLAIALAGALGAPCALPSRRSVADMVAGTEVVVYDRDRAEERDGAADAGVLPGVEPSRGTRRPSTRRGRD